MRQSSDQYPLRCRRYQVKTWTFRYGTGATNTDWQALTGYSGYGRIRLRDGTTQAFTVVVTPESVADQGGTIAVTLNATSLAPGTYDYDVWLTPPSGPSFPFVAGKVTVEDAVSPPPS